MYEVFGLTEEQGKAIDRALCRVVAPVLGCKPEDISDEAILNRVRSGQAPGFKFDVKLPEIVEYVRDDQNLFEIREEGNVESLMSRLAE